MEITEGKWDYIKKCQSQVEILLVLVTQIVACDMVKITKGVGTVIKPQHMLMVMLCHINNGQVTCGRIENVQINAHGK